MTKDNFNQQFFSYLQSSPTPFHAVANIENYLLQHNFSRLHEDERWYLKQGESYFVSRENGAIIAFSLDLNTPFEHGFRMLAAHTDSPCLKIKPLPDIKESSFLQLGVEVYGGCLLNSWFDRDLSLAGRVCCETGDSNLEVLLVDFERPMLSIPRIAIHLDREANKNKTIHQQYHLPPVIAQEINGQTPNFNSILKKQLKNLYPKKHVEKILSVDMFCYDSQPPAHFGQMGEFISGGRLDNLLSCFVGMTCLAAAKNSRNNLLICTNHEENGSVSTTGASGAFIDSVLERIIPDPISKRIMLHNSFLVSMDNAHATHPNFKDKSDPSHKILLNRGPVIKNNANQRYATNSISSARFKRICEEVNVTPQEFVMRSDMPCGSTVGPITAARLGIKTVDVGVPTLAMHSIRELTGTEDPHLLYKTIYQFLKTDLFPKKI
ncbi:MAG: M18 family aminopeptidase [Desulfobulbaceae bacterium]|nr:M18 family aminopeptidase [Desulfobulbaceae bacterium]